MKDLKLKSVLSVRSFWVMLFLVASLLLSCPLSYAADTIKIGQLDPASGTFKTTGDQYNAAIKAGRL